MNKVLIGGGITVILLGLAYLGSVAYVGSQVEAAVQDFKSDLIQSDELIVHRLDYAKGFRTGKLHYDLEWSPSPESISNQFFTAMEQVFGELSFRHTGTLDVTHGPWVGGNASLGLARMELEIPVEDSIRQYLPQYPGDAPVAWIVGLLGIDGKIRFNMETLEYDGRLVVENQSVALMVSGIGGELVLSEEQSDLQFTIARIELVDQTFRFFIDGMNFDLEYLSATTELISNVNLNQIEFSSPEQDSEFVIDSIRGEGSSRNLIPGVWLGDYEYTIERILFNVPEFTVELLDTSVATDMDQNDAGLLTSVSNLTSNELNLAGYTINDIQLGAGYDNVDPEVYAELLRVGYSGNTDPQDPNALLGSITQLMGELLAEGPSLRLSPISVSLVESGDTSASLVLGYDGPSAFQSASQEELLNGISVTGELTVTTAAARRIIEIGLSGSDDSLSGASLASAADARYEEMNTFLADTGLFTLSEEEITSAVQIANGVVSVNGEEYMSIGDALSMVQQGSGTPMGGGPPAVTPTFGTDGIYQTISLQAGFTPDPYTIELDAGGENTALSVLGADCPGNVYSQQPDVVVNYSSGTEYGLYLYAESEADTTLIVLAPDGWYCDDDSHGDLNPGIEIDNPQAGSYRIWTGTYDGGLANAMLGISEYQ